MPLRITDAERAALVAYRDRRGLGSLNDAMRDLIHRTTLTAKLASAVVVPAVQIGPVQPEYGGRLKKR